jgi:hypothetical protein
MKTFKVTYTKSHNGQEGSILVKALDNENALKNARNLCATGEDFRNPTETEEDYSKPRKQGFAGYN